MSRLSTRSVTGLGTLALLLLASTGPTPTSAWGSLSGTSTDPLAPVLGLVTLLAWAVTGWLAGAVLLTVGAHLPGQAGRAVAALAGRVVPVAVRRIFEVALGLTVAVGALAAPAAASTPAPSPAPLSLDWGGQPTGGSAGAQPVGSTTAPDLDWTTAPATAAATTAPGQPAAAPAASVVVQPGDTLWELAEAHLQTRTGAVPSVAQVAEAWPSWWAANREAVGPDPHLLLPGTPLHAPGA